MSNHNIDLLNEGLTTAFVDWNHSSNLAYRPQFVSNNYTEGHKVLSSIEDELLACQEFLISVAFITMGGITPLLQTFKELEERGIPVRILTTDYLMFTEPRALETLHKLKNIEIKIYVTNNSPKGFHTKGYVFKKDEMYRIIVGSSNMTLSALTTNKEWNTKVVSTNQSEYVKSIIKEYKELWNSQEALNYDDYIDVYAREYARNQIIQHQKEITKKEEIPSLDMYRLQPNSMQVGFIQNLKKIYESGENRALLISATGDGGIIMTSQAKTA